MKNKKTSLGILAVMILFFASLFSSTVTKLVHAAEKNSVVTGVTVDKTTLGLYESMNVKVDIHFKKGQISAGDTSVIQLSKDFQYSTSDFNVVDRNNPTIVVATVRIDQSKKEMIITYNEEAARRPEVTAEVYFLARVDYDHIKEPRKLNFQITVDKEVKPIAEIEYKGPLPGKEATPKVFDKAGWNETTRVNRMSFSLNINQTGESLHQAMIVDKLQFTEGKIDLSTLEIKKGRWALDSSRNQYILSNRYTANDQFTEVFTEDAVRATAKSYYLSADQRTLIINIGRIHGDEGYRIRYQASLDGAPEKGKDYQNKANFSAIEHEEIEEIATVRFQTGWGFAETNYPMMAIVGEKKWNDNDDQDGLRPKKIIVILKRTIDGQTSEIDRKEVTEADNWTYQFENLPEYDEKGNTINYSIDEEEVSGYTKSVNGYNLVNSHSPVLVEVPVSKVWQDEENKAGKRPASILVNLLADGKVVQTIELSDKNNWNWVFSGLPKYHQGKEIYYTLSEEPVADYVTIIDQVSGVITNTYNPGKTSLLVNKIWQDNQNQDGLRPTSILVQLYVNGQASGAPVELSEQNNWTYQWSDLDTVLDGQTLHYTVAEVGNPEGYTATITEINQGHVVLVNSRTPIVTAIQGHKTWQDQENQFGLRPSQIEVILKKSVNGSEAVEVARKVVTAESGWSYQFDNLPQYENGKWIDYSISEVPVPHYQSEVRGSDLVNTLIPPTPPSPNIPPVPGEPTPPTPPAPNEPGKPREPKESTKTILPKTGEQASTWMGVAGILILAGLGIVFLAKKKKN